MTGTVTAAGDVGATPAVTPPGDAVVPDKRDKCLALERKVMDDQSRPVDPFLTQLAELCQTNPTGAKWVFVPSHALGWTLGERLALEGVDWANLRFHTPLDLALQMAAPFLVERGVDPVPDGLGSALVARLLMDLPVSVPGYFRELAEQPRMADALWATLRELRMAGLTAADLVPEAFDSAAKAAELRALLAAYERHLETERRADAAAVYREALEHLDVAPLRAKDVVLELPDMVWAPLERRLLDGLPGTRVAPRRIALTGLERPRRHALLALPGDPVAPDARSDTERLAWLMKPEAAPAPHADGTLSMFRAGGREAEVEEAFRRILASETPLDQVELACASTDQARLAWEKAQRHGWPITVATGLPVTLTRPARALLAFCAWIADALPASGLRRLLQSGDVRLELEDGPTAGQAARLLARSGATWGRQGYAPALAALAEHHRSRAADAELDDEARAWNAARAAQVERLGTWLAQLLDLVPEAGGDGRVPLGASLAACAGLVEGDATVASELDGAARGAITDAVAELGALADLRLPPDLAFALVRDRLEALSVGGERARPGHLHVTSLALAGLAGRPVTLVLALEEHGVLPPAIEDPVLLDGERARLSPALATSTDRAGETLAVVVSRVAVLGGRVCLSYACRDLRAHRETFPSWLLLQILRLQAPRPGLTYRDLDAALGEPVSLVPSAPAHALSDDGWWLAHLRNAGASARERVRAAFPALSRGEDAEAARGSTEFTPWDGLVREAAPFLDPRLSGRPVSATALENLAKCPFRYLLERGLRLEPVEDAEPEAARWLDPATRGGALHALYAAILRETRDRGERPDPARHGPRLHALGAAKLAELRRLIPPPSDRVFEQEERGFHRDLDAFLTLEAEASGRTPVALEVSFGLGEREAEPLARRDPVLLDLGGGLRFTLRGSIDRIDRLRDGTYETVDYKTGSVYLPGGLRAMFAGGRQLQHALYALAATELLRTREPRARVSASSYYFPTVRGAGRRADRRPQAPAALAAVLRDLFDVVGAGAFVHTPDPADCGYCDFFRACGEGAVLRAETKIDHDGNDPLDAFRRLRAHG